MVQANVEGWVPAPTKAGAGGGGGHGPGGDAMKFIAMVDGKVEMWPSINAVEVWPILHARGAAV
jgi:hypothetical protein